MNKGTFIWPDDAEECATLARSIFISECVSKARNWIDRGSHLLTHGNPESPYIRPWSDFAKEDRAYREVFATLSELQRIKVKELLEHCIGGAVFSTLCTIDQFPGGEAEVFIRDGVCGCGNRRFRIAPTDTELHDDFKVAFEESGNDGEA